MDSRFPNESLASIQKIDITKLEDVFQLLSDQPFDTSIGRYRSPYFYRGLSNVSYPLLTTLQRNCKDQGTFLEESILRNFAKYAIDQDPQIVESIWRQLVIGQHHGLPTRLLDWTYSPLVALHFAVNDSNPANISEADCVVWKIHCEDLNVSLPQEYKQKLWEQKAYLFTVEMLSECAKDLATYDRAMALADSIALLEPPSVDQRIINQYSYFTVMPSHIKCFEKYMVQKMPRTTRYVISKNLRWRIRDMLDQMNINERTLLPGFDGIAAWLKRYYFSK